MRRLNAFATFPANIPTHPLLAIDYELLKAHDNEEVTKLWEAATELGSWYLKNHGVDEKVSAIMSDMGAETMVLPLDEKMEFEQDDNGMSFGYKAPGTVTGAKDNVEFINIAKDDL
ncbi:hypothetical protein C8Q74DRAFT_1265044 [Fomes fomentarius]|nr:hypothetical protein C8Q74DRAFT_1265044 [Fomes fomentarius]